MKEERLLDLNPDGSITSQKVRDRLNKFHDERDTQTLRHAVTVEGVRHKSNMLLNYLVPLEHPEAFDAADHDDVKRNRLAAYVAQS